MIRRYFVEENSLASDTPEQEFEYNAWAAQCEYTIMEDFCTSIPGWRVDILFVVLDGPSDFIVFIIEEGKPKKIEQDKVVTCEHCAKCPLMGYEVRKIDKLSHATSNA